MSYSSLEKEPLMPRRLELSSYISNMLSIVDMIIFVALMVLIRRQSEHGLFDVGNYYFDERRCNSTEKTFGAEVVR
jgi:hypothetical protein